MLIGISTLRAATENFAECNKLGEGGFGAVYKVLNKHIWEQIAYHFDIFVTELSSGWTCQGTLPDGKEIAVKRLSKSSRQGVEELKNELASVAKLEHKNLVTLLGVCLEQQERLLVYEFVSNGSLDNILFGNNGIMLNTVISIFSTRQH
jgi:serine/threonine protein kinase